MSPASAKAVRQGSQMERGNISLALTARMNEREKPTHTTRGKIRGAGDRSKAAG